MAHGNRPAQAVSLLDDGDHAVWALRLRTFRASSQLLGRSFHQDLHVCITIGRFAHAKELGRLALANAVRAAQLDVDYDAHLS
jgi:hypothetical protein